MGHVTPISPHDCWQQRSWQFASLPSAFIAILNISCSCDGIPGEEDEEDARYDKENEKAQEKREGQERRQVIGFLLAVSGQEQGSSTYRSRCAPRSSSRQRRMSQPTHYTA